MKRLKKLLVTLSFVLTLTLFVFGLASCNGGATPTTGDASLIETSGEPSSEATPSTTVEASKTPQELLDAVVLESEQFEYDGQEHNLSIKNLPEGATVKFTNNARTDAGNSRVTATITLGDLKVSKVATLTVNSIKSKITAPAEQVIYNVGAERNVEYTVSNDVQKVNIEYYVGDKKTDEKALYTPGEYRVRLNTIKQKNYAASEAVWVDVKVIDSLYDVKFDSVSTVADGTEKSVTATATLPEGFTLSYENNTGTTAGDYYAKVFVKNANGEVVETHYAVLSIDNPDYAPFDEYCKESLIGYFGGDPDSLNVFFEDPEAYGFEREEAVWYTYKGISALDLEELQKEIEQDYAELNEFLTHNLSKRQMIAYRYWMKYLTDVGNRCKIKDYNKMTLTYIDHSGGYVSSLADTLENYIFRTEQDVKDALGYLTTCGAAFESYVNYASDKIEWGYPISDHTLTEMIGYLNDVAGLNSDGTTKTDVEKYYLYATLAGKVNEAAFFTDAEKASYIEKFNKALDEIFMPAVKKLAKDLEQFKGKCPTEEEGYLSVYENGKDLYVELLKNRMGETTFDAEEYESTMLEYFLYHTNRASEALSALGVRSYSEITKYTNNMDVVQGTPEEMLKFLQENFAKTIVYELEYVPEIKVKKMDDAVAKLSNTVAYYRKSTLSVSKVESITLNPRLTGDDKMDLLATLAHEGYPGHLYSYCYSKSLNLEDMSVILTNVGYGEGWATYVEIQLYKYLIEHSTNRTDTAYLTYLYENAYTGHVIYTLMDFYIHYKGYGVKELGEFLSGLGYNSGAAQSIYELLIEVPGQYASYGYGRMSFVLEHEKAQAALAGYYDEKAFNAKIQSEGWVDLGRMKELAAEYIQQQSWIHGITE